MVDSEKLWKFVISLANDVNDETPWQKIKWWKATFPAELQVAADKIFKNFIYGWEEGDGYVIGV